MTITTGSIPMAMKYKGKKDKSFCKGNRAKAKLRCKKTTYKNKKKKK